MSKRLRTLEPREEMKDRKELLVLALWEEALRIAKKEEDNNDIDHSPSMSIAEDGRLQTPHHKLQTSWVRSKRLQQPYLHHLLDRIRKTLEGSLEHY